MMSHKEDDTMSEDCREQLRRRQKLMLENYKVSRGLAKACKQEIKENNCKKTSNTDIKTVRLAQILLCLEGKKCHLQYVFTIIFINFLQTFRGSKKRGRSNWRKLFGRNEGS